VPLIVFAGFLCAVLSLALLGEAAYLLWSWYEGYRVIDAYGVLLHRRESWRLWTGLGLLAWSFLGRWIAPFLLAWGVGEPSTAKRGEGWTIPGGSGASLYVESHGPADAPTIIFTHGWGLDSTIWSYAKRALGQRFRLILWDLPGLGKSSPARDGAISLTDFAADLRTVIGLAKGRRVVLVGHSIGGMTIQTLARDDPEMFGREVAGVVLVNTTYTNPLKTMVLSPLAQALRWPLLEPLMRLTIWLQPLAWLSAWQSYLSGTAHLANRLGFGRHVTRSQLEHTTLLATRNPPGALAKGNLAMFRWDGTAALPKISVPTLVLSGDLDIVTKLEASRFIASAIPSARLKVIQGVNHMGFLEQADAYNEAIGEFAAATLSSGSQGQARSSVG
jgi:pimeloyl-ACP methyl ester carboxylesterase